MYMHVWSLETHPQNSRSVLSFLRMLSSCMVAMWHPAISFSTPQELYSNNAYYVTILMSVIAHADRKSMMPAIITRQKLIIIFKKTTMSFCCCIPSIDIYSIGQHIRKIPHQLHCSIH